MLRTRLSLTCLTCLIVSTGLTACQQSATSVENNKNNDNPNDSTAGGTTGGNAGGAFAALPRTYTATLKVVDTNGNAVSGAQLGVGGITLTTDAQGLVHIPSLPTTGLQSATVSSAGLMSLPLQLAYADAGHKVKTVVLHAPQVVATFAGDRPATVDLHAHSVAFAQGSFQDADGTPYTGTVHVAADSLDPATQVFTTYSTSTAFGLRDDFNPDSVPAGARVMQTSSGALQLGLPEAMVNIEAQDANGNDLHLAEQTPATVHMKLTPFTQHTAGEVLPLLSYDPNQARWVQQGNCTVQALPAPQMGFECVGTVQHFSAVAVPASNADSEFPCGNFNVTLDANLKATAGNLWLEELITADAALRSTHTTPTDAHTLCYVGATAKVRVAMEVTADGNTQILRSDPIALSSAVMNAQDLDELQAGHSAHACFKCSTLDVHFGAAAAVTAVDGDGDGYYSTGPQADCNDHDVTVHPGAAETACDSVDKNCDGHTPSGAVTRDNAASAAEWNQVLCRLACAVTGVEVPQNEYDEDCDGIVSDRDKDGFYGELDPALKMARTTAPDTPADCDDQNPNVRPGARELAGNSVDEDCDGYAVDADGDGYIARAQAAVSLANVDGLNPNAPAASLYNDCDDWDATINPNQHDLSREAVFAQFYAGEGNDRVRGLAMCAFLDPNGALSPAGRALLVDVNCDGTYSDLDGDGFTAAGDVSLGQDRTGDCQDLDPRVYAADGNSCPPPAAAQRDAGSCMPRQPLPRSCPKGYDFSRATGSCQSHNFCAVTPCDGNDICVNVPGSYQCIAPPLRPGLVSVTNITAYSATVQYGPVQDANGGDYNYVVVMRPGKFSDPNVSTLQAEGTFVSQSHGAPAGAQLSGLMPSTQYSAAVVAGNANVQLVYNLQLFTTLSAGGGSSSGGTGGGSSGSSSGGSTPPGGGGGATGGGTTDLRMFTVPAPNGALGGIAGADSLCQGGTGGTGGINAKAVISDGNARVACGDSACTTHTDWALQPNTLYVRPDGTHIASTDAHAVFTFPLANAVDPNVYEWFSGLASDWSSSSSTCAGWMSGKSSSLGAAGAANANDSTLPYIYDQFCDRPNLFLICAEQR